jgi:hypothetical protein
MTFIVMVCHKCQSVALFLWYFSQYLFHCLLSMYILYMNGNDIIPNTAKSINKINISIFIIINYFLTGFPRTLSSFIPLQFLLFRFYHLAL